MKQKLLNLKTRIKTRRRDEKEDTEQMDRIMELIEYNPKLASVKPLALE